jgi:hypothetical protein
VLPLKFSKGLEKMKTAQNPYVRTANTAQTRFRDTRTGGPAVDEHRMEKGAERTFASRRDESGDRYYEINAGSRRELISRIAQLQAQVASGAEGAVEPPPLW